MIVVVVFVVLLEQEEVGSLLQKDKELTRER